MSQDEGQSTSYALPKRLNSKEERFLNYFSYQLEIRYKILKLTQLQRKGPSVNEKSRCLEKCWTLGSESFIFLKKNVSCSNDWTLWFNLADCNVVMKMKDMFGGLFIVAKREKQSDPGTSPHQEKTIVFAFEVETTGKAASQFGKENMISRA